MDLPFPRCPECGETYRPRDEACACGCLLESLQAEPPALDNLPPLEPHGPPPPPPVVIFELHVEGREPVRFRGDDTVKIPLRDGVTTIGRRDARLGVHPDIDLRRVSDYGCAHRDHAHLELKGGRLFIVDHHGDETTAIDVPSNTLPKDAPVELRNGDRLIVGGAVTFVVVCVVL